MNVNMILAIIEKLLLYGPNSVIAIADAFRQEEKPTVEQIRALKIEKDPEEYF